MGRLNHWATETLRWRTKVTNVCLFDWWKLVEDLISFHIQLLYVIWFHTITERTIKIVVFLWEINEYTVVFFSIQYYKVFIEPLTSKFQKQIFYKKYRGWWESSRRYLPVWVGLLNTLVFRVSIRCDESPKMVTVHPFHVKTHVNCNENCCPANDF